MIQGHLGPFFTWMNIKITWDKKLFGQWKQYKVCCYWMQKPTKTNDIRPFYSTERLHHLFVIDQFLIIYFLTITLYSKAYSIKFSFCDQYYPKSHRTRTRRNILYNQMAWAELSGAAKNFANSWVTLSRIVPPWVWCSNCISSFKSMFTLSSTTSTILYSSSNTDSSFAFYSRIS